MKDNFGIEKLDRDQLNLLIDGAWHLDQYNLNRVLAVSLLIHQIMAYEADLNMRWYYSPLADPLADEVVVVGDHSQIAIPVNQLNTQTALDLLRKIVVISMTNVLQKNGTLQDGGIKMDLELLNPRYVARYFDLLYLKYRGVLPHIHSQNHN